MAADRDIVYRISVAGIGEVRAALRGIMALLRQQGHDELAVAKVTSEGKKKVRTEEEKLAEKLRKASFNAELKARNADVASAMKAIRDKQKAAEQALTKKQKAEDQARARSATEEEKLHRKLEKIALDMNFKLIRERAKADRKMREDAEKEALAGQNKITRDAANAEKQRTRDAEKELRARSRAAERAAHDDQLSYRRFGSRALEGAGSGLNRGAVIVGQTAARAVRGVAQGLGLTDAVDIPSAMHRNMELSAKLSFFARESRKPGERQSEIDPVQAEAKIRMLAKKYGRTLEEVTGAVDKGFEMGQGPNVLEHLEENLKTANVVNTDPADVAQLRAQLHNSKPGGIDESTVQNWNQLGNIMGKTQSMRYSEFSHFSARLIAAYAASGQDVNQIPLQFMSVVQKAKSYKGTGAPTVTTVASVFADLVRNAEKLKEQGVDVIDAEGNLRSPFQAIKEAIVKTKGDPLKLKKMFPATRGGSFVLPMAAAYHDLEKKRPGAGNEMLDDVFESKQQLGGFKATATNLQKDFDIDDAQTAASPDQKRKVVLAELRGQMDELATGAIDWYMGNNKELLEVFKTTKKIITEHPILAASAVVGGAGALGAIRGTAGAGMRLAGEMLGGKLGGAIGGMLGGTVAAAGSTPVYVTGAAPGVMPSGGGGLLGGLGGLGSMGSMAGLGTAMGSLLLPAIGVMIAGGLGAYALANTDSSGRPKIPRRAMNDEDRSILADEKRKREEQNAGITETMSHSGAQNRMEALRKKVAESFPDLLKSVGDHTMTPEAAAAEAVKRGKEKIKPGVGADGKWGALPVEDTAVNAAQSYFKELEMMTTALGKANIALGNLTGNVSALKTVPVQ